MRQAAKTIAATACITLLVVVGLGYWYLESTGSFGSREGSRRADAGLSDLPPVTPDVDPCEGVVAWYERMAPIEGRVDALREEWFVEAENVDFVESESERVADDFHEIGLDVQATDPPYIARAYADAVAGWAFAFEAAIRAVHNLDMERAEEQMQRALRLGEEGVELEEELAERSCPHVWTQPSVPTPNSRASARPTSEMANSCAAQHDEWEAKAGPIMDAASEVWDPLTDENPDSASDYARWGNELGRLRDQAAVVDSPPIWREHTRLMRQWLAEMHTIVADGVMTTTESRRLDYVTDELGLAGNDALMACS